MDTPITRAEHEEFAKRLEEEDRRQNKRIQGLEETLKQMHDLTVSVASLAKSVESIAKEQARQGEQLDVLEGRDGEKWRNAASNVLTTIIGIVLGVVFSKLVM